MPVAIRVGLWLTFFVFLNKYRKMQINYIGTYLLVPKTNFPFPANIWNSLLISSSSFKESG